MWGKLIHNGETIAWPVSVTLHRSSQGWGGVLRLPKQHSFDPRIHQRCTIAIDYRRGEVLMKECDGFTLSFKGNGPLHVLRPRLSRSMGATLQGHA